MRQDTVPLPVESGEDGSMDRVQGGFVLERTSIVESEIQKEGKEAAWLQFIHLEKGGYSR